MRTAARSVAVDARGRAFVEGLAARRRIAIADARLMHEVAPDGPAGLAAGVVSPHSTGRRWSLARLWARARGRPDPSVEAAAHEGSGPEPPLLAVSEPAAERAVPPGADQPEAAEPGTERQGVVARSQQPPGPRAVASRRPTEAIEAPRGTVTPPASTSPLEPAVTPDRVAALRQPSPRGGLRAPPEAGPPAPSQASPLATPVARSRPTADVQTDPGQAPTRGAPVVRERGGPLRALLGFRRVRPAEAPPAAAAEDRVYAVPGSVRTPVELHFGVDLSDVPVRRGPRSDEAARRMGAQAFTAGAQVHVPTEAGPLDAGRGRALLTHELVHVVQQRRLAPALPSERSSQGPVLENEARSVAAAARRPGRPTAAAGSARDLLTTEPVTPQQPPAVAGAPLAPPVAPVAPVAVAPTGVQRATDGGEAPAGGTGPSIDDVVSKIYDRITSRLRAELLIDRERAGALTDVR